MKLRTELILAFIACALIIGSSERALAVQYLWQVALEEIEGSMQHEYAKKFIEIIEETSNKNIRCNIHFYGELGTSGEITKLLQRGDLQFAFQSPGHLGSYIPEVQVFSIYLKMGGEGAEEVLDAVIQDIKWAEQIKEKRHE